MELVLTRHLADGNILAKDVYDEYGRVLLKTGTKLNIKQINLLKSTGIYFVTIIKDDKNIIKSDTKLNLIKQSMVEIIPDLFKAIQNNNKDIVEKEFAIVGKMVEYIIDKKNLNTSLFDIKEYDDYTYTHCVNTSIMATFIGMEMNLSEKDLKSLATSAILHDIGKMKISIDILNKKGKLDSNELIEMNKHPIYGYDLLKNNGIKDPIVLKGLLQHHERINGTGYPLRLRGEQISIFAKIISVCDVFTALSANRSYRKRFNPNDAYEYILAGRNEQFDSNVVDVFKKTFAIYPIGYGIRLSNGMEGVVKNQNPGFPDRPVVRVRYNGNLKVEVSTYDLDLLKNIDIIISEPLMESN